MKLLVDENIPFSADYFAGFGEVRSCSGRAMTAAHLSDIDVLLVRSVTRVDAALLGASPVRFVGSATSGIDHIDTQYLAQAGIGFCHAPGANARSVVEYVLAAALYRARLRAQNPWPCSVGIVGLGHVGGLLYHTLSALGFECFGYDPLLEGAGEGFRMMPLAELMQQDIVTLHTPISKQGRHATFHLLGETELAAIPRETLLVNAARGPVIDNKALLSWLETRPEQDVVLDVWEGEPNINRTLLDKVLLATPHIAGYSYDAKVQGTHQVYRGFCQWLGQEASIDFTGAEQCRFDISGLAEGGGDWLAMAELVSQVYDISGDDATFRQALANEEDTLKVFEALRRNYPKRREAVSWMIPSAISEGLHNKLAAMGCRRA